MSFFCPNIYQGSERGGPLHWNPPHKVPTCLVAHLKVIGITGFQKADEELKMLEYFQKIGEVLEKLIIDYEIFDFVEEVEVLKQLLRSPRGSKFCQIQCVYVF